MWFRYSMNLHHTYICTYIRTIKNKSLKVISTYVSGDDLATSLHTNCIGGYCALLLVNIDCICMGIAPYP